MFSKEKEPPIGQELWFFMETNLAAWFPTPSKNPYKPSWQK